MTEHTTRLPISDEPAFSPLRRTDLPSFLVAISDNRILMATPACEALGVRPDAPAPLPVKAITRTMGGAIGQPPRLERIRLPNAFVPRLFSCAALPSPGGPVVLFAAPEALVAEAAAQLEEAPQADAPLAPAPPDGAMAGPGRPPVRFTWEMDADGRFTALSLSLSRAVSDAPRWIGRTLEELVSEDAVEAADAALDAVRQGATFAGAGFRTSGTAPAHIEIGGVPLFNGMKQQIGWRGFGLAWPGREQERETQVSPVPAFAANVVPLRGSSLTPRERSAFDEIARTLTTAIDGWARPPGPSHEDTDYPSPPAEAFAPVAAETAGKPDVLMAPTIPWDDSLLNRLPIGLAVQQDGGIVFLNDTLLAWLALEDLPAFIRAGGFGALLIRDTPEDPLCLRTLSGPSPVDVRLIKCDWQGRPAVIHVLRLMEAVAPRALPVQVDATSTLDLFAFPILVIDRSGSIQQANAAAAALCGFPADELQGEPFTLAFATDSQAEAVSLLDPAIATDLAPEIRTLTARGRDGAQTRVEVTLARMPGEGHLYSVALRLVGDGAQLRETPVPETLFQDAALPSEQALSHFVRRLSHGVRSPLNGILGFVESVRASSFGPVGNSRYSRHAEAAAAAAQQLLATLEDIEALAHPGAAETVEVCNLVAVVASAVEHVLPAIRRRRQVVRNDCAAELMVRMNRDVLAFLVRSVLEEAVRATPTAGQIMVSAQTLDEAGGARRACILIRDGGPSLSEPQIAQALSPFQAAKASDRFSSSGRPFRLARLAAVLKANGGELRLRRGVESGMLCEICLPL